MRLSLSKSIHLTSRTPRSFVIRLHLPSNVNAAPAARTLSSSHHLSSPTPYPLKLIYFAGCATKFGKQSSSVLACLFVACSVNLSSETLAPFQYSRQFLQNPGRTYAGARVVFKNVDLQTSHWISLACSLTFSCDLATPLSSLSLRARFEAAFAP